MTVLQTAAVQSAAAFAQAPTDPITAPTISPSNASLPSARSQVRRAPRWATSVRNFTSS